MQPMEGGNDSEASSFKLKTGTDKFTSRSNDVFASLGALEDKHSAFLKATASSRARDDAKLMKEDPSEGDNPHSGAEKDTSEQRSRLHERSRLSKTRDSDYEPRSHSRSRDREDNEKDYRGGGSGRGDFTFRRPYRPPRRGGRQPLPDFKKNPEKYTCYSLGDVSERDMSDRANTQAAFAFLEERRLQREKEEREMAGLPEEEPKFDVGTAACSQGVIAFSRPKQKKETSHSSDPSSNTDDVDMSSAMGKVSALSKDSSNEDGELKSNDAGYDIDTEVDSEKSHTETKEVSNTFKARKNVKRHIRRKDSDGDSD